MKLLDRHLLREFSGYLGLAMSGLVVLFLVVDLIEKIDVFLDHRAKLPLILQYFAWLAPDVVVKMLPVALLLATFLALGQLNKFGELTAMRATGLSLVRILRPVFAVALLCTLVALALGEFVAPTANRQRDEIFQQRIQNILPAGRIERGDVTYLGGGGRIWTIRLYRVAERQMQDVSLQEFKAGSLWRRIDARRCAWDGRSWVFYDGWLRSFVNATERAEHFERMQVNGLAELPDDFAKQERKPDQMNLFELGEYVRRLRSSGARTAKYRVDLHLKLAFPLVCLIVVMIGGALATRLRMQSAAMGFGLSVAISVLYYVLIRAGQALGHNGVLPPVFAAWMGDLVFGTVGIVMMVQAQRR